MTWKRSLKSWKRIPDINIFRRVFDQIDLKNGSGNEEHSAYHVVSARVANLRTTAIHMVQWSIVGLCMDLFDQHSG